MGLGEFGLSDVQRGRILASLEPGQDVARVTAVNRLNLELETEGGPVIGELAGRLRFAAASEAELPAVGDWVGIQHSDDFAVILSVVGRETTLERSRPGTRTAIRQIVAANVDTAFIVHGCDRPYNPRRMERFATMAHAGGVRPAVLLAKADVVSPTELQEMVAAAAPLGQVASVRALESGGLDQLEAALEPGKTYALLGASGAGKTTILNGLLGKAVFATSEVRESDRKGKHTTTRRQLVRLPGGALLVDTPGIRELGMTEMQDGVSGVFSTVADLAEECRYSDCQHQREPGCAVREAIDRGELDEEQLVAFHKLEREAARFSRSVADQRQRDKAQGKLYKSIIAGKRDRR